MPSGPLVLPAPQAQDEGSQWQAKRRHWKSRNY